MLEQAGNVLCYHGPLTQEKKEREQAADQKKTACFTVVVLQEKPLSIQLACLPYYMFKNICRRNTKFSMGAACTPQGPQLF